MEYNPLSLDGQSFDSVLEKIKQGMKAARANGWVDTSDSGSELELAHPNPIQLAHHPRPNRRPSSADQHSPSASVDEEETMTDSSSLSLGILPQSQHSQITPPHSALPQQSLQNHLIHPDSKAVIRPYAFQVPHSPFSPITPPPGNSLSDTPSPYVRHHFKWEFQPNPNSLDPSLAAEIPQPRLIETPCPTHLLDHDSGSVWSDEKASKHPFIHPLPPHPSDQPRLRSLFSDSQDSPRNTVHQPSAVHNPSHLRWDIPSDGIQKKGLTYNAPHNLASEPNFNLDAQKSKPVPTIPTRTSALREPENRFDSNRFNPASVSSVPFSFAPAAPVRLRVPDAESQRRSSRPATPKIEPGHMESAARGSSGAIGLSTKLNSSPAIERPDHLLEFDSIPDREKQGFRPRLVIKSPYEDFAPNSEKFFANPPSSNLQSQTSRGPKSLPGLFQHLRLQPGPGVPFHPGAGHPSIPTAVTPPGLPNGHRASSLGGPPTFYNSLHSSIPSPFTPIGSSVGSSPATISSRPSLGPSPPNGFQPIIAHPPPSSILQYPRQPSPGTKPPFSPVALPVPPPAVSAPLPGQVQPEEARKSVKTQPPVVNTGNSGAMIPQPGDWMCMCGFVNWRRRKVCMRCFPFADGNDSVGAMMAMNAQRAAMLAAGGTLNDNPPATTAPPASDALFASTGPEQSHHAALRQIFGGPTSTGEVRSNRVTINPFDNSVPLAHVPRRQPTFGHNPSVVDGSHFGGSPGQAKGSRALGGGISEEDELSKEWAELDLGTARQRSCSMSAVGPVWAHQDSGPDVSERRRISKFGTGSAESQAEAGSMIASAFDQNPESRQSTTAVSPGSSWQAIRALWQ